MPRQVQVPTSQPPQQQYAWKPSQLSPSPQPSYPANQPLPHSHQPQRPPHAPVRPPDPVISRRAPIVNRPPQGPPPPAPPRVEPIYSDPRGGIPHPSPGHDYARENPKIQEDYMRLTFAIEQSVSAAVRCAIRQNWQKCLMGTSFHQGFMLNALLDSAPADVAKGSIKDFGRRVVKIARAEFVSHLDTADIDEIAGIILAKASNQFLDAALEARLRTIDAKPLINALARAERLGYEPDDIVEEPVGGQERVIPQNVPEPPPLTSGPAPPPMKQCRMCNRVFDKEPPYVYHVANQVCMQRPEGQEGFLFSCSNCGQGFENNYALTYHNSTGACSKYETRNDALPAPKPPATMPSTAWPSATMSPEPTAHGAVGGNYGQSKESTFPAARSTATPVRMIQSQQTGSPSGPGLKTPTSDPYAHLSEAQLAALNEELQKAEKMYTEKFREAEEIVDLAERQTIIGNLKNSFGTRQSIIRKKWGVRLRERRTKAEIEAEKARMGLLRGAKDSSPATGRSYGSRSTPTSSQANGTSYDSVKRMRTDDGTGSQHGTGSRGSFDASEPKRKTPTPAYHLLETPRAQPLPRPVANDDDNANNSDSSSDNDDIPARLPDSVRQSLSASQRL
ncbi:hypothetical protein HMPREF1624_02653 [Sporothrix schenckii ATCC 58251]|uniref:C2H2-type domain-containing protein n=1 Tax=Sporothrix schenckii (strain ATCC 58251 / de Perez 2211183) TaxID=1391915 RepID=U7Q2M9_SPOS1|nr:hypothetical protein HMPREF1624_02653 [Sporothrix schenckii ATCC 58251]